MSKVLEVVKRGPGRPKGSKNKPKTLKSDKEVINLELVVKTIKNNTTNNRVIYFDFKPSDYDVINKYSTYKYRKEYTEHKSYICVSENPTGNCQLTCVGYFNNLIMIINRINNIANDYKKGKVEFNITNISGIFRTLRALAYGKRMTLLDIKLQHLASTKKILKSLKLPIVSETNYKSTNNSSMNLLLVKIANVPYSSADIDYQS